MTLNQQHRSTPASGNEYVDQDCAKLAEFGIDEADIEEAMAPAVARIREMAVDIGMSAEAFFDSLDDELFGALCVGYLSAKRSGYTGAALVREADVRTAAALVRVGRADLGPLALALGHLS
ncbi:hypothetical protein ACWCWD_29615 [Streptomyces sp. NPDC001493]